jgi:tight adherence protein B
MMNLIPIFISILIISFFSLSLWLLIAQGIFYKIWKAWTIFLFGKKPEFTASIDKLSFLFLLMIIGSIWLYKYFWWAMFIPLLLFLFYRFTNMRARKKKLEAFENSLDQMYTSLSNSLQVNGNLEDSIADVADGELEPMKSELKKILAEVKLGIPMEKALDNFAKRSGLISVQMAISSLIIGKRTGGNLSAILKITAETQREMNRLAGELKTRTAEGRGQAVVMGLVPPFLCVILHFINPEWLEPMWNDPIGWLLLLLVGVLEVISILIIRKIMAVDL